MSDTSGQPGTEVATRELSPELVERFATMATMIPGETGDAVESIITAILNAPGWDALDQPWEAQGAEELAGVVFQINSLKRRPSRYKDGLGLFLVIGCIRQDTGESFTWTTSATGVVAQLVAAYARDWLPLWATVVIAERPTESGYRPHHLKFFGPNPPAPK